MPPIGILRGWNTQNSFLLPKAGAEENIINTHLYFAPSMERYYKAGVQIYLMDATLFFLFIPDKTLF